MTWRPTQITTSRLRTPWIITLALTVWAAKPSAALADRPQIIQVKGIEDDATVSGTLYIRAFVDGNPKRVTFKLQGPSWSRKTVRRRPPYSFLRRHGAIRGWNTNTAVEGPYTLNVQAHKKGRVMDSRTVRFKVEHQTPVQANRQEPKLLEGAKGPDETPSPEVSFAANFPALYQQGSGGIISFKVDGTLPSNSDVLVLAWSDREQRMVNQFAHSVRSAPWSIQPAQLKKLPPGRTELQLLLRVDQKLEGRATHWIELQPAPAPKPTVRFASNAPAQYAVGSGESIGFTVDNLPAGWDVLVLAWSNGQNRMVDEFAHSLTSGPWQITPAWLDKLPAGDLNIQLLARINDQPHARVTHWMQVSRTQESSSDDSAADAGDNDGANNDDADDSAADGGDPQSPPAQVTVRFAPNTPTTYETGSGADIDIVVEPALPANADVLLLAWSDAEQRMVGEYTHALTSAPWRFDNARTDQLPTGSTQIQALLRVRAPEGLRVVTSATHWLTIIDPDKPDDPDSRPEGSGWTQFTKSPDTRLVYVSPTGDDKHDGLSPERPVKTAQKGYSLIRHGHPDWLLFRRGDVFHGGLGTWAKSGNSATEPMLVGAYGDPNQPRPKFATDGKGMLRLADGVTVRHVAFTDLHAYANQRDPDSPDFAGGRTDEWGIKWWGKAEDVLFEGLLIECFSHNMCVTADRVGDTRDITLRRCVLRHGYLPKDLSWTQGLWSKRIIGLTLDQNIFHHNGFEPRVRKAERIGYNHHVYLVDDLDVRIVGNIFARESFLALKIRSDGADKSRNITIRDNLFVDSLLPIKFSSRNQVTVTDVITFRDVTVSGNVFTKIGGLLEGTMMGMAVKLEQVGQGVIEDNLIVEKAVPNNWWAIEVATHLPHEDTAIRRNIVHAWDADKWLGGGGKNSSEVAISGNLVNEPASRYVDASRTMDKYVKAVGHDSLESFMVAAGSQSKGNWSQSHTAAGVNQYFREGFELTPFD